MTLNSLRRFYCCLPLSHQREIISRGIHPGWINGKDSIRVFYSKDAAEKELKRQLSGLIVIIDGSKLNPQLFKKVDYNNLFYKGIIPTNAFSIHKSKLGRITSNARRSNIRKKGRKL